jgi:hypothetical protein
MGKPHYSIYFITARIRVLLKCLLNLMKLCNTDINK